MRIVEGDVAFNEDETEQVGFRLSDGTLVTEYDGVDHKDNPARVLMKLTKKLKWDDELVEIADGSDTLWYGIIRAKVSKSKASRNKRK